MFSSLLYCAVLAVGQSADMPPQTPGSERPAPPTWPYPSGRSFASPDNSPRTEPSSPLPPPTLPNSTPVAPTPGAPGVPQQVPTTLAEQDAPAENIGITLPASLFPSPSDQPPAPEKPAPKEYRRAMPSPWDSPPIPGSEYQGYPIIGVPPDFTMWPMMKALQGTYLDDALIANKIRVYGWVTAEANLSTSKNANTPDSYWIRPNNVDMDQALLRVERNLDSVQTDHIDWGFRSTLIYGIDYRYMTAGGWFSDQLLKHNELYGWDPTEQYIDVYIPWVAEGMIVRVGRWIACPDIETQFAPDNYMGSHSLLFTFDTYTQTGVMFTFKLNDQWTVQAAVHSGTDMAPWYKGSLLTGAAGVRWVSKSNNDAFYGWLNAINSAEFRRFQQYGQPLGHDNFNYWVQTWEHRFSKLFVTKTESYFMWQRDAVVGGTPSAGPTAPFGGGGGIGANIPGLTLTYGVLNYTLYQVSHKDFLTFRNEWWKDSDGERSGFASTYTSNAIGITHNFTDYFQMRPEIGYYRSWTVPAFDNGTRKNQFMLATDVTLRF
jgi:Putative beta-barrel porin-2, OmpL-like. bbp2